MPRKKKSDIIPAKLEDDVSKLISTITSTSEKILEDTVAWAKKHKMLVLLIIVGLFIKRYFLEDDSAEEGDLY